MTNTTATPTSVYRYYDVSGILIYVGVTGRGISRNSEHNKSKEWWPLVTRQGIDHFDTRDEALAAERRLIIKHAPPYNRQHNPCHDLALSSYQALVKARGEKLTPTARREVRSRLWLYPLEKPFPGDTYTLRTRLEDSNALHGELIQGDQIRQRVSTPDRGAAGSVTSVRYIGGFLVIGIRGKYLPSEIIRARATVKTITKPPGFMVKRVLLNEPDDMLPKRGRPHDGS